MMKGSIFISGTQNVCVCDDTRLENSLLVCVVDDEFACNGRATHFNSRWIIDSQRDGPSGEQTSVGQARDHPVEETQQDLSNSHCDGRGNHTD